LKIKTVIEGSDGGHPYMLPLTHTVIVTLRK
jgi:hypothetical protein